MNRAHARRTYLSGEVRFRLVCGLTALACLAQAGCATQALGPTPSAFADAAAQAASAFAAARAAEADAFRALALQTASRSGRITTQHCLEPDEAARCAVLVTVDGQAVDTGAAGARLAMRADALVAYGEALRAVAAAQDIAAEQAAVLKLGQAAGAVFAAAGVPGVSAATGVAANVVAQLQVARRRQDLLKLARAVDPAMAPLAAELTRTTLELRTNIVLARSQAVVDTQSRLVASPPGSTDRAALVQALFEAAARERSAAALSCDFSALPRAHSAMLVALADPKLDPKAAIAEIGRLADELKATQKAFAGSSPS